MLKIEGKYNFANVMIDDIDESTRSQIQSFLDHEVFAGSYIAIMPDCHAGKGAVIGFTMPMNKYIIPNIIGVDIGCGMLMMKFNVKAAKVSLEHFDKFIHENIPAGMSVNEKPSNNLTRPFIDKITKVCETIGIKESRVLQSVGSLGGGNHFIEAGADKNGYFTVTIHTGSRNFGKRIAEYYQGIAKTKINDYFIGDDYKDLEFLIRDSQEGQDYMSAMVAAQWLATMNRDEIMLRIASFLVVGFNERIESVHNFIDNTGMIRKGATSAHLGQKVIIPFNSHDGISICEGKGSKKYNFSAPHGAGRILSRSQARKTIDLQAYQDAMNNAGVYSTTVNKSTIDEAPMAYKPMDVILQNIKETVKVVEMIKPIYNFKASED